MSRRPRMKPWKLGLDAETERNLALKAKAHKVTRPALVRSLINGVRPGAVKGSDVALADAWWDSRSPSRRVNIWRNHVASANNSMTSGVTGQLSIEDALETEGAE